MLTRVFCLQFLHAETDRRSVLESHLLLLTEDGYVDLYHVMLTKQEGYRVVMANPERLLKNSREDRGGLLLAPVGRTHTTSLLSHA
ncbi:gamma-secretase-activating protein-like [Pseudochaenichthys georgianus]|uniref:gamma-secretase-activating protein-like n=1 Tax=Pseudochaenichthys georgianus TaxID=52239 RepID=UPI0039C3DD6E